MRRTLFTLALILSAAAWSAAQTPKPAEQDAAPITVYLLGDSTMAEKDLTKGSPERGWGTMLQNFFDKEVRVANYALNGRSTTSIIHEGIWAKVRDNIKKGDYVFIQFGTTTPRPASTASPGLSRATRTTCPVSSIRSGSRAASRSS